ncbi:hypothetical protein ACQZ40_01910 [Agrobacterium sp. 16-172Ci]
MTYVNPAPAGFFFVVLLEISIAFSLTSEVGSCLYRIRGAARAWELCVGEKSPLDAFIEQGLKLSLAKGYPATIFRRMVAEYGTVEAVRRLAEADALQSGLRELAKLDLLNWSAEAAVGKFPELFPNLLTRESAAFKLRLAHLESEQSPSA